MKMVQRRASALGALLLLGAASAGCTDEQTGFFVMGNMLLDSGDCVVRAEGDATLLFSGLVDVALRPDYVGTLLVGSQLAPRGDKGNLRTETMIASMTGAEVRLYNDTGALATAPFTVPAPGVIRPESSDSGFGIVEATLIPASTGADISVELTNYKQRSTYVAEVVVFGKTIGGLEVETSPFTYVIRACEGCLIEFPPEVINPSDGSCSVEGTDESDAPCRFGQDNPVSCTSCSVDNPFCRFPSETGRP
jgi:hypothetical protein